MLNAKLKLYRSNVLSILLYGAKCWNLNAFTRTKFVSLHFRRVQNIQCFDYVSNEEELNRAGNDDLDTTIRRRRRWRYVWYALRMNENRLPHVVWMEMWTTQHNPDLPLMPFSKVNLVFFYPLSRYWVCHFGVFTIMTLTCTSHSLLVRKSIILFCLFTYTLERMAGREWIFLSLPFLKVFFLLYLHHIYQ